MNEEIAFVDGFAGIGGFRLGLEKANNCSQSTTKEPRQTKLKIQFGRKRIPDERKRDNISDTNQKSSSSRNFECVWSNEWDKYCAKIYQKNFGEAPDTRDIRTVPSREIPDHDLFCAGWPCQSFSVAGKGAGFEDTRGTLFFEIARILRDKRPRYLLLENVKGLLSHQEGETFQTILRVLADLGYRCQWQVLNSKHFGVPQNRERVFIVGCLGGRPGPQVFPLGEIIQAPDAEGNVGNISGTISTKNQSAQAQWDGSTTLVATCLDANYHKGRDHHGQRTMVAVTDSGLHRQKQIRTDILPPLRAGHKDAVQLFDGQSIRRLPVVESERLNVPLVANTLDRDGYLRDGRRKRVDDKAVLTSIPERRIRRLTPVECERLQGFPDNFTAGVSDTQRYKALGNAVTVNVIEAIGRQLMKNIGRRS